MEGLRPGDPQRVGRYRLLNRLGTGGMGRVYLGQSPSGRQVAVKIIRAELADNADFRQRFRQEVKAARRVGGIFTAPVVDADPDAPEPWMVTAFVSGPSLAEAVTSRGPMPVGAVLILAAGLAEGLSSVHAAGLVHRDLKPSNVLLASDGPRIIDFGISRSAESVGPTRAGGVIGSPGFMSPEQALGEPVGPASDIFSLGSVLAYAATGEPPFGDGPPSALLFRVVHGEVAIGNVPQELRPLIDRCLLRDPKARPTTDELLAELGEAVLAEGWLDWHEEPAWQVPRTLPSEAWGGVAAMAGYPADEMPAEMPPLPAPADGDHLPGVLADVAPPGASAGVRELPDFAAAGTPLPGRTPPPAGTPPPGGPPADAATDGTSTGQTPAGSIGWLFPDQRDGPPSPTWRPPGRWRKPALATAGVLGVVVAGAVIFALLPRSSPSAAAGPAASQSPAGASAQPRASSTPQPSPSQQGGAPLFAAPLSPAQRLLANVVLDFFQAINERRLPQAWTLGGEYLYPTQGALTQSFNDVANVAVVILRVRGDLVEARLTVTQKSGTVQTSYQTFVVQNGAIVRRGPTPAATLGDASPTAG
jgi:hypothetical protein